MNLFPFFVDISDKTFLVIGSGSVAAGKVKSLKKFTDNIIVLAPSVSVSGVTAIEKEFEERDLEKGDYVIAATDNKELNSKISGLCMARNLPVNSVDDPENCTFIFPSLIKRGDLTIGIASGGKAPAVCKEMRGKIEEIIPVDIEEKIDELFELRNHLKETEPDIKKRSARLKAEAKKYFG